MCRKCRGSLYQTALTSQMHNLALLTPQPFQATKPVLEDAKKAMLGASCTRAHSKTPASLPAAQTNVALQLLYSRTRRKLLRGTAAGLATSLLANEALQLKPQPACAAMDLESAAPNPAFDLGLQSDFNVATGRKLVLPEVPDSHEFTPSI